MKGRTPTPTVIKEMRGTNRADRGVKKEAAFETPGRMPSPPDVLTEDGQHLWRTLGKTLLDAGLFTAGDTLALQMLCISYERFMMANRNIGTKLIRQSKNNPDYYEQNPLLPIANKAWDQMYRMLSHFGLTPAERTRVLAAIQDDEEDDLYSQLFTKVSNGD